MFKQISRHPSSGLVPKATYSVGWIYENVIKDADSAALWYRQLLKAYPGSVYALEAQPRVAVKDDPKSLDRYVKINRIEPVAKPPKPTFGRRAPPVDRVRQPEEDQVKDPGDEENDDGEPPPDEDEKEPEDPEGGGGNLSSLPQLILPELMHLQTR